MNYEDALSMLGSALADPHPTLTVADLDLELRTSPAATLWTTDKSVVFLRLEVYENGVRALCAAPAAGDLQEILEHGTHAVEETARENGCTQVLIQAGRKGWARALKEQGYEEVAVVLRKVLD
jgi:hypothetical protein